MSEPQGNPRIDAAMKELFAAQGRRAGGRGAVGWSPSATLRRPCSCVASIPRFYSEPGELSEIVGEPEDGALLFQPDEPTGGAEGESAMTGRGGVEGATPREP